MALYFQEELTSLNTRIDVGTTAGSKNILASAFFVLITNKDALFLMPKMYA
jgi:hypothetical protein